MKAVLISIQPKWVEKIASGQKTIEVRKNRPKIETPFKCYIYCTIGNGVKGDYLVSSGIQCGKVIGEFTCDKIICSQAYFDSQGKNHLTNVFEEDIKRTCLTEYELWNYIAGKSVKANEMYDGYLWHISDLKIYGKPRELNEFKKETKCYKKGDLDNIGCWERGCPIQEQGWCDGRFSKITRPSQSYMFVEEN